MLVENSVYWDYHSKLQNFTQDMDLETFMREGIAGSDSEGESPLTTKGISSMSKADKKRNVQSKHVKKKKTEPIKSKKTPAVTDNADAEEEPSTKKIK